MIQHIQVDHNTHDAITQAARDEGMAYDAKLACIVMDWAAAWRGRQHGRREFITAIEDTLGVIPGGD